MSVRSAELDRRSTPMGEISLRRRLEPTLLVDVYEAKLDDEHRMSSLFTTSEIQLARLPSLRCPELVSTSSSAAWGLGYTD